VKVSTDPKLVGQIALDILATCLASAVIASTHGINARPGSSHSQDQLSASYGPSRRPVLDGSSLFFGEHSLSLARTDLSSFTPESISLAMRQDLQAQLKPGTWLDASLPRERSVSIVASEFNSQNSEAGADFEVLSKAYGRQTHPSRAEPPASCLSDPQNGIGLPTAQPGLPDLTVSVSALQGMLALPVWQRLPANIDEESQQGSVYGACSDLYGSVIREMQGSPEKLKLCDPEPKAIDLLFGGSLNRLANAISESTSDNHLSRRPEKVAINWTCYLMCRVSPFQPTKCSYKL
jgi:hypothetical protein